MESEDFPDEPLEAIPAYRAARALTSDGESEAGPLASVRAHEYDEEGIGVLDRAREDSLEIGGTQEAGALRQRPPPGPNAKCGKDQGIRRARPFARRDCRTFRPFRVAIRARKPWVRARLSVLG